MPKTTSGTSRLGKVLQRVQKGNIVKSKGRVWNGPEVDGVTFSLLSRFICCKERFRLMVVEGLRPAPSFEHRIEYGNLWHTCEEAHAAKADWEKSLIEHGRSLCRNYLEQQSDIIHWYNVCRSQFPVYLEYWSKHEDTRNKVPLCQEKVFKVPYELPSGRIVLLRGKLDAVEYLKGEGVVLQENKTKGDIVEKALQQQLLFDLQTMIYCIALNLLPPREWGGASLKGRDASVRIVRYNVVRRPLSGGKHSIRQHKPSKQNPQGESQEAFYKRLQGLIREEPEHYFMRWKVMVTNADMVAFCKQCLNPLLEELCDWWGYVSNTKDVWENGNNRHWRMPYGVYNPTLEGRSSDLDFYLATGNETGLVRVENLFTELS